MVLKELKRKSTFETEERRGICVSDRLAAAAAAAGNAAIRYRVGEKE
jgi:hypothetical protein